MVSQNNELKKYLSEKFGFEVGDFIIIAKGEKEEDLKYVFSGPAVVISGLLSWFTTFVNLSAFKTEYKESN